MKNKQQIGKSYGVALYSVAKDQNKQQIVYEDLQALLSIYQSIPKLSLFLSSNELTSNQRSDLFNLLIKDASDLVCNLLKVINQNKRFDCLEIIIDFYEKLYNKDQGFVSGEVVTVVPLSEEQLSKLEVGVARLLGFNKVKLENHCNDSIVGGLVVKVDNYLIDNSLKTKLINLRKVILDK